MMIVWIPFQAKKDQEVHVGEEDEPTRLIKGDWYCRGKWLSKLPRANNWWTMDGRECLVRMQQVLHSSLPLVERSESNPFRSGVPSTTVDHANEHGAWLMSEDDHSYMVMRRRQVDGMDYPDGVFADLVSRANLEDYEAEVGDDDDIEMEEEDDMSVESIGEEDDEEDDDSMDESSVESMVEESEEEEEDDGEESV